MKFARLAVACAAAAALCFSGQVKAQAVYGSINGTVTDNTGAVVPNATITVTDVSKGTAIAVKSNASGEYLVEHLIPDTYNLKVEAQGFETFEATGVLVQADTVPENRRFSEGRRNGDDRERERGYDSGAERRIARMWRLNSRPARWKTYRFRIGISPTCSYCCPARNR